MVSDVHRTILYGGIFVYPADKKSPRASCACCTRASRWRSSSSRRACLHRDVQRPVQRMLDLVPTNIHERCPVILGSKRDVDMVLDRYK